MLLDLQGLLGHSLAHGWSMGADSDKGIDELSEAIQVLLHKRFFMPQLPESSLQSSHRLIHTVWAVNNHRGIDELTIHPDETLKLLQVQPENTMDVSRTPGLELNLVGVVLDTHGIAFTEDNLAEELLHPVVEHSGGLEDILTDQFMLGCVHVRLDEFLHGDPVTLA